jgi:Leucine-rich repeat (LRR) protein
LDLSRNNISDIDAIRYLINLEWLDLSGNEIIDITALENLHCLEDVYLQGNKITDIKPLINNWGIIDGVVLNLDYNPLNYESLNVYLLELSKRNVRVSHDKYNRSDEVNNNDILELIDEYSRR